MHFNFKIGLRSQAQTLFNPHSQSTPQPGPHSPTLRPPKRRSLVTELRRFGVCSLLIILRLKFQSLQIKPNLTPNSNPGRQEIDSAAEHRFATTSLTAAGSPHGGGSPPIVPKFLPYTPHPLLIPNLSSPSPKIYTNSTIVDLRNHQNPKSPLFFSGSIPTNLSLKLISINGFLHKLSIDFSFRSIGGRRRPVKSPLTGQKLFIPLVSFLFL